jgi:hypothetical protein
LLERGFTPVRFRSLANDTTPQLADVSSKPVEPESEPKPKRKRHRRR